MANFSEENFTEINRDQEYLHFLVKSYSILGGIRKLSIPIVFFERFKKDDAWRETMLMKYAKLVFTSEYPKVNTSSALCSYDRAEENTGVIPKDEKFAVSDYWCCPLGFEKKNEDLNGVVLTYTSGGYNDDIYEIFISADEWPRFISDKVWRVEKTRIH